MARTRDGEGGIVGVGCVIADRALLSDDARESRDETVETGAGEAAHDGGFVAIRGGFVFNLHQLARLSVTQRVGFVPYVNDCLFR